MGSLIKHAKKIKKACIGIATGITVATMMIPPIVLSQMIMMDQEDKCSSEATGSINGMGGSYTIFVTVDINRN